MNSAVITYGGFAAKHKVTISSEWVDSRPDSSEWSRDADHWKVKLRYGKRSMSFYYSKGSGHHGEEPTVSEVLCCLAIDASTTDNAASFEEWADEFGFDRDSRKAEKTWKSCTKQNASLKRVLGDDLYTALLEAEEGDDE